MWTSLLSGALLQLEVIGMTEDREAAQAAA
jgi:hypothetical protein